MAERNSSTTRGALRDAIVADLREKIIDGKLAANYRLNERELSQVYGVSRVPIREAIIVLEAEGLVDVAPRVGATVTPLTRERVREIFELRSALEPLAARLCAMRAKPEDLEALHQLVERARTAGSAQDIPAGADSNAGFHELLYRASGNKLLQSMVPALNAMTRRLFRHNLEEHEEMMWQDHADICSAIESGDADYAAELTARHLEHTRRHTFQIFVPGQEL